MSLDVKNVIQIAKKQFIELLPDLAIVSSERSSAALASLDDNTENIRLEELERDGSNWEVTFSVPNPDFKSGDLLEGIRHARHLARIAKTIVVDGEEGKLIALRERES